MHLIQLIEKEIRTKQISQRTLARMVGVSNGTISNILVGHVPVSTKILDKFASYFGVSVGELRGESISAVRESQAPYYLSPRVEILARAAESLKSDELATLERCVDAFRRGDKKMTRHLIGQLELLERIPNDDEPDQAVKSRHS